MIIAHFARSRSNLENGGPSLDMISPEFEAANITSQFGGIKLSA